MAMSSLNHSLRSMLDRFLCINEAIIEIKLRSVSVYRNIALWKQDNITSSNTIRILEIWIVVPKISDHFH